MAALSADDIKLLAEQLELIKKQARKEIDAAQDAIRSSHGIDSTESVSFSDQIETGRLGEVRMAEIHIDRNTLNLIHEAELRMSDGLYGICLDCDEAIPRERMFALPMAVRCAPCQEKFEEKLR